MPIVYPEVLNPLDYLLPPNTPTVVRNPGQKINVYNDPLLQTDLIGNATLIEKVSETNQLEKWRVELIDEQENPYEIVADIKKVAEIVAEP